MGFLSKGVKGCFAFFGSGFILLLVGAVVFRLFVAEPFVVRGSSMAPNFYDSDYLWIEKITHRFTEIKRGAVVVFEAPDNPGLVYIKRVIGLPGERVRISNQHIYISKDRDIFRLEEPYVTVLTEGSIDITLGEEEFFVVGDNRSVSEDSRFFGPVHKRAIVGKAWLRLLPSDKRGFIRTPEIKLIKVEKISKNLYKPGLFLFPLLVVTDSA